MSRKTKRNLERKAQRRPTQRRQPSQMRYVLTGVGVLAIGGLIFAGAMARGFGSGGDDDIELPDVPTVAPGDDDGFGDPPTFDGYVVGVSPGHGETVTQEETRTEDESEPGGVCADVEFGGEATGNWFRMAVDGEEVTQQTIWDLTAADDPQAPDAGTLCFDPPEGLPPGTVDAAVSVQDPANFDQEPQEVVSWTFEVVD